MGYDVVEKLADFPHGVFGRDSLVYGKATKSREHRHIDGAAVIKEDVDNFLVFCVSRTEEGELSSFSVYCTFCPYFGLTCGCSWCCGCFGRA